jgi:hypothetical protein
LFLINFIFKSFDDIYEEIPSDDIYEVWLWKIDNGDCLCDEFLKLSHLNFVAIADAVERDPAFIEFKSALIQWDVPMKLSCEKNDVNLIFFFF